jgi:hypothetical protein
MEEHRPDPPFPSTRARRLVYNHSFGVASSAVFFFLPPQRGRDLNSKKTINQTAALPIQRILQLG